MAMPSNIRNESVRKDTNVSMPGMQAQSVPPRVTERAPTRSAFDNEPNDAGISVSLTSTCTDGLLDARQFVFATPELISIILQAVHDGPRADYALDAHVEQARELASLGRTCKRIRARHGKFIHQASETFRYSLFRSDIIYQTRAGLTFSEPMLVRIFNRYRVAAPVGPQTAEWLSAVQRSHWTSLSGQLTRTAREALLSQSWSAKPARRGIDMVQIVNGGARDLSLLKRCLTHEKITISQAKLIADMETACLCLLTGARHLQSLKIKVNPEQWEPLYDLLRANQALHTIVLVADAQAYPDTEIGLGGHVGRPPELNANASDVAVAAKVRGPIGDSATEGLARTADFTDAFAAIAQLKSLQKLALAMNCSHAAGLALCALVRDNTSLSLLSVSQLPESAMAGLCGSLSSTDRVQKFSLQDCVIGIEGASRLAALVSSSRRLETLQVTDCELQAGSLGMLSDAVNSSPGLRELRLEDCSGDDFVAALGLLKNTGLRRLVLRGFEFYPDVPIDLGSLLAKNPSLSYLELSDCTLDITSLCDGLRNAPGLRKLILADMQIALSDAQHLAALIRHEHCSLRWLEVGAHKMQPQVRAVLEAAQLERAILAAQDTDACTDTVASTSTFTITNATTVQATAMRRKPIRIIFGSSKALSGISNNQDE